MAQLTDFINICRLCLTNLDDRSVNLFLKQEADDNSKVTSKWLVSEMVEVLCNIKIAKDDRLPECICSSCWTVISSMHTLRMVSFKSDQHLNNILNTYSYKAPRDITQPGQPHLDYQIEFIDTKVTEELEEITESLAGSEKIVSIDDTATLKRKTASRKGKATRKKKLGKREEKISCEMCGKLVAPYAIEYHLNAHKDVRPYKCEATDCEKYFTAPFLAKHHFRKVHVYSITRPKKCDVCGKGFIQQSSLLTHRSYHFDPQIPCPICGQLYRNKRALQRHSLVHSGERKYPCSECNKSFQTSFTLKTHMRIHTLEKPFECTECSKTFAYKCLLKGHMEKHHRKEVDCSNNGLEIVSFAN